MMMIMACNGVFSFIFIFCMLFDDSKSRNTHTHTRLHAYTGKNIFFCSMRNKKYKHLVYGKEYKNNIEKEN